MNICQQSHHLALTKQGPYLPTKSYLLAIFARHVCVVNRAYLTELFSCLVRAKCMHCTWSGQLYTIFYIQDRIHILFVFPWRCISYFVRLSTQMDIILFVFQRRLIYILCLSFHTDGDTYFVCLSMQMYILILFVFPCRCIYRVFNNEGPKLFAYISG